MIRYDTRIIRNIFSSPEQLYLVDTERGDDSNSAFSMTIQLVPNSFQIHCSQNVREAAKISGAISFPYLESQLVTCIQGCKLICKGFYQNNIIKLSCTLLKLSTFTFQFEHLSSLKEKIIGGQMIQISGGKSAFWWEQKRQMSGGKSDKLGGGKSDKGK